jgi:hypothetical protein
MIFFSWMQKLFIYPNNNSCRSIDGRCDSILFSRLRLEVISWSQDLSEGVNGALDMSSGWARWVSYGLKRLLIEKGVDGLGFHLLLQWIKIIKLIFEG